MRPEAIQEAGHEPRQECAGGGAHYNADRDQNEHRAEHLADHPARPCAERESNTDFGSSPCHAIGGHSVETDGGKEQRQAPEKCRQHRQQPFVGEGGGHPLRERAERERQIGLE